MDEVTIAAGDLEATFLPDLGMVGTSLRHRGEELLDLRHGLEQYAERGKVLGLPLLHPWANRLADWSYEVDGRTVELPRDSPLVPTDEHDLPIHGLLPSAASWRVVEHQPERVRAELDFGAHDELLELFPFPHVLELEAALAPEALTVIATLRATGDVAVPVSFGFHPFLRLPGVPRERWQLTLPSRRALDTDGRGIPTGGGDERPEELIVLGERGYDDGFGDVEPGAAFAVAGGGRELVVRYLRGYADAQVFSPPGAEFVCFEPMTAPANALRSGDGLRRARDSFTAVFAIAVSATG
jgi:galactose mutarotase-like enzyme